MAERRMIQEDCWREIETLFHLASELPPAEVAQFLSEKSSGEFVRSEVEALLNHTIGAEEALLTTISAEAESFQRKEADSQKGKRIGAYNLVSEIGRGGMGTVYLAVRSDEQFQQQVAIKVISRGMASESALRRFRRERQVLADLAHPNISRLLDGGTTPEGFPFFAMEYLEGLAITEYCQKNCLSTAERLRLFLPVCDAVHYAHRQLVIHRDIKPGNILVTREGIPKLVDFGIAKLVDSGKKESGSPQVALTFGFASPEQLQGGVITTAADIYSMGVVLRTILDAGCKAPVGGDLAFILARATRAVPQERYNSAQEFGEDIRRYLAGRPVLAHPDGAAYRISCFVRRHRLNVLLASCLAGLTLVGMGLYVRQARLAQRRFQELHHLANSFVFDIDDKIRELPGSTLARTEVAKKAVEYLNALAAEKSGDKELQREVANAYRRIADLQGGALTSNVGDSAGARRSYERSIALLEPLSDKESRKDLARSYSKLAWLERVGGNVGRAQQITEKALPVAASGATEGDPDSRAVLAEIHLLATWVYNELGKVDLAGDHARKGLALYAALSATNPDYRSGLADGYSALGGVQIRLGQTGEALESYRRTVQIREVQAARKQNDPETLRNLMLAHSHIGDTLGSDTLPSLADPAGALASYQKVLAIASRISAMDPSDKKARMDLSIATMRVANVLAANKQPKASLERMEEALRITRELALKDPHNTRLENNSGMLLDRMGTQQEALGHYPQALESYRGSLAVFRKLLRDNPKSVDIQLLRLAALEDYAGCLARSGAGTEARQYLPEISSIAAAVAANGSSERFRAPLARAYARIGGIEETLRDGAAAVASYRRGVEAWTAMSAARPLSASVAAEAARASAKLAQLSAVANLH